MTSSEACENFHPKDEALNKELAENLEPWNMFTVDLLTPKIEPKDFDVHKTSCGRENALPINNISLASQASEFVPKVEPEKLCDYSSSMEYGTPESVCIVTDRNNQKITLKQNVISLKEKIKILNRLKHGENTSSIAKSSGLSKVTIKKIKKKEDRLRKRWKSVVKTSSIKNSLKLSKATLKKGNKKEYVIKKRFSNGCSIKAVHSRKYVSLEEKIKILNKLKDGEGPSSVKKSFNLSKATIQSIKQNEDRIRKSVSQEGSNRALSLSRTRDVDLVKTEDALKIWFEDCADKKIPLNSNAIRQKALKIYQLLKQRGHHSGEEQSHSFIASDGWLQKLKKRFPLHLVKLQGEQALADQEAVRKFMKELSDVVLKENYLADQIFNADETAFHWKKVRTYLLRNRRPGFEDRITLLLCSNASGDFTLKPLVVNCSLNPPAMQNKDLSRLPVLWRANEKAWMTETIFSDWFHNCFVPSVESYLCEKGLDYKVLLLLDDAISHDRKLSHPNVKIIFFPTSCSSLIQPLEQGGIRAFFVNYICQTFEIYLSRLVKDKTKILIQVWNEFSILDCVRTVSSACDEIKPSTLNACWKTLLPQMVQEGNTIPSTVEDFSRIINVASNLISEEFKGISIRDVEELFLEPDLSDLELSEEELLELIEKSRLDSSSVDNFENLSNGSVPNLSVDDVQKGMDLARKVEYYFSEKDPSVFRHKTFKKELLTCLAPYQELLADLQS